MYINFVRLLHVLWSLSLLRPSLRPPLRVLRNSYRRHRHPRYRHFRLILSFRVLFVFSPFSTICLSVGFSVSAPLRAHISHHIHSRFVPASNFSKIGTLRASGHLERTSGSRMRASEHRKRTKGTKNTHYNLHPRRCVRTDDPSETSASCMRASEHL